jgi:hypothetical protein
MIKFPQDSEMKKSISLITILFIVVSLSASSFSFTGDYTLTGKGGISITASSVDTARKSVALSTTTSKAEAESDSVIVRAEENSLLTLSEKDGKTVIYLVYGSMTVMTTKLTAVSVYTPVSYIDETIEGEIYVTSTDTEEKVYNFSPVGITVLDLLRGKRTSVPAETGFDYMKDSYTATDNAKRMTEVIVINVPSEPVFTDVSESTVPEEPQITRSTSMTVTQTLVDIDDESGL